MRRREFIAGLGGAAVFWPLAANAQQAGRVRRIGILLSLSPAPEFQGWVDTLLQTLAQSGWIVGQTIQVDIRWGRANAADVRRHAAELAAAAPDVIVAHGASVVGPLLQTTRTIPVVFPSRRSPRPPGR